MLHEVPNNYLNNFKERIYHVYQQKTTAEPATVIDRNKADYDSLRDVITAVDAKNIDISRVPPEVLIGEAEKLYYWSKPDGDALVKAGLPVDAIERLQVASGAFLYAEAALKSAGEEPDEWRTGSKEAAELRDYILRYLLYALGDDPEKLKTIRAMAKGRTHDDTILQLQAFSLFGRENREWLEATGFDVSLFDKASELSDRMSGILGDRRANAQAESDARVIRDQAYVYIRQLIGEIRRRGKFVFYRDKERLVGYASDYSRKLNKRYKKEVVPDTAGNAVLKAAA